jgi:HD-GYP domain-containing protein (c-di-GMP phosphodiesterase class II)
MLLAEQLVGEARERRASRMNSRERVVDGAAALLFVLVAVGIAVALPSHRLFDPILIVVLVAGYAVVSRVRFEFGEAYVSAEELVFVAMLLLLPAPLVPLLVAAGALLAVLPDCLTGEWHRQRWISKVSECWFAIGPVLVVALLASGTPTIGQAPIYAAAFAAQMVGDFAWAITRDRLVEPMPLRALSMNFLLTARVSAILSSMGLIISLVAVDEPVALVVIAPVVWLLAFFSKDRRARYSASLELNRAYRGTVMLLADVVEFDDSYTADHSRSVVDLVTAVANELGMDQHGRQELEFAALLHDIGKITIPKQILHKPARLSPDEFEVMKTHTIEGQFMLDRVGGLLGRVGEIVRSCHERWDGNGYPDGLAGAEIPFSARIVFPCDAYNAMTTNRPYRSAMSQEDALAELAKHAGTQFDPDIVAALSSVVAEGEPEIRPADQVRALVAQVQLPERASALG